MLWDTEVLYLMIKENKNASIQLSFFMEDHKRIFEFVFQLMHLKTYIPGQGLNILLQIAPLVILNKLMFLSK